VAGAVWFFGFEAKPWVTIQNQRQNYIAFLPGCSSGLGLLLFMKRVVIINAVYPPEPVVSAQMGRDLADYLAHDGAQVTVLCPYPTRPMGVVYPCFQKSSAARVDVEGEVKVVRLPSFTAPQSRLVARMRESWSFGWQACRFLENQEIDVVYANPWPLFGAALIARHCSRHGIPLVLHIKDIYPESLQGKIPRWLFGWVSLALTALDRWILRRVARVVVISENMRRTYVEHRGAPSDKVIIILDWVDERRFAALPTKAEACAHYNIPAEPFTFLYLGNIGPVAGVEGLIEAFHAAGLKSAQLVIAGDGSSKAACVDLAQRLKVNDVRFISDPDAKNVPLLQSLGHVCLLSMRKDAGMSSIPSKLMAYLLSAKPVLATVDLECDTSRAISEAKCGWVGEPENIQSLAAKMTEIAALPLPVLDAMGQCGRSYGLKCFSKGEGVRRLGGVIASAANSGCRTT
jgi:glycosyltransferase involved in cell wall biosynthesis